MNIFKKTITCKGVNDFKINRKIKKVYMPKAGDLALFKVMDLGKHTSVQGVNGNNTYIFPEDYVICAFGNRYASDQFEGYVPEAYEREYHLLGKGGVVGTLASMHSKFEDIGVTKLRLVGYLVDENNLVINSKYYHQDALSFAPKKTRPYSITLSLGTSMDSGKTTTAGFLCRGLRMAKQKVAYIKLTGTVYTKDRHFVRDCGAHVVADFSNFGFPSTYLCSTKELLNLYESLLGLIEEQMMPDHVVIEIADGLLQRETKMLLNNKVFLKQVDNVIFSGGDSMGILSGLDILNSWGIQPFAVSGLFTASPLLQKEVEQSISLPVLTLEDMVRPEVLNLLASKTALV